MTDLVFITGAKGFLGRYCARHFAGTGRTVAGLGYGEWPEEERQGWGISDWHSSPVTVKNLERLTERNGLPKAVIHCAGSGSVGFSYEHPHEDFLRTVSSTAEVLEFVRRNGPGIRVAYPSSAAVYGAATHLPISENAPLAPVSPYGKHKQMAEECCRMFGQEWGIPVAVIRFFSIYGEELRKQLLWDACLKALGNRFTFFGAGTEIRDWLHVQDAARLAVLAIERAAPDCPVVNGGTGNGVMVKDMLTHLGGLFSPALIPAFSGQAKAGDPLCQTANTAMLRQWKFSPSVHWKDGVSAYVAWFHKEREACRA